MDLHYSQTQVAVFLLLGSFTTLWIYTILKLHCFAERTCVVLLPYGFTLFSNLSISPARNSLVLLPYGFTLFSNEVTNFMLKVLVLLPYGFTLFSNGCERRARQ